MNAQDAPHRWPDALDEAVRATNGLFTRSIVLAETDSTQDAARRMRAGVGTIITTLRQTKGRGRLGRAWADTAEHGIAVTFCLPADLALRATLIAPVAVAETLASFINYPVGIKWPNDVVVDSRKIAGVLIERFDDAIAHLGIGINIAQTDWPAELAHRAISLHQLGANDVSRLAVLTRLTTTLAACFNRPDDDIASAFRSRDVLTGSVATFLHDGREVRGRVGEVDPARGLRVETESGPIWLPALTTSVVPPAE